MYSFEESISIQHLDHGKIEIGNSQMAGEIINLQKRNMKSKKSVSLKRSELFPARLPVDTTLIRCRQAQDKRAPLMASNQYGVRQASQLNFCLSRQRRWRAVPFFGGVYRADPPFLSASRTSLPSRACMDVFWSRHSAQATPAASPI